MVLVEQHGSESGFVELDGLELEDLA